MPFGPMSFLNPFSNPMGSPFMQMGQQACSWMQQAVRCSNAGWTERPNYGSEQYYLQRLGRFGRRSASLVQRQHLERHAE